MTNIKNIINSLVLAGVLTCTPLFVCATHATEEVNRDTVTAVLSTATSIANNKKSTAEEKQSIAEEKQSTAEEKIAKIKENAESKRSAYNANINKLQDYFYSCDMVVGSYNYYDYNERTPEEIKACEEEIKTEIEKQKKALGAYNKKVQKDLSNAEKELSTAKKELKEAQTELSNAKQKVSNAKQADESYQSFSKSQETLDNAKTDMDNAIRKKEEEYTNKIEELKASECKEKETKKKCKERKAKEVAELEQEKKLAIEQVKTEKQSEVDNAQISRDKAYSKFSDGIAVAAKDVEEEAKRDYDKKAQELQDAQRKCASGDQSSCDSIEGLRAELEEAKETYAKAHEHTKKMGVGEEKIKSPTELAQDDYYIAQQDVNEKSEALAAAERTLKEKEAALAEAKAACEHSKRLKSKQGKEEAAAYCKQAEDLEKEVDEALQDVYTKQVELEDARMILTEARKEAFPHENQDYLGFSVNNNDEMYNKGKKDVFKVITRRAAFILYHLKPVIYMLAGFGLIGFAFAAIFNKISWKWFGNLAIGLFLVANTGRLVEYMVFPSKGGADYMELERVGVLNSFGDQITLSQALGDAQYAWVDNTYYVPNYSPSIENNAPNTDGLANMPSEEENKKNTRGFCEAENEGGGLFGGGAFTSCVKDIISAGKKAADTVKQAQSTVDAVKNTVNQVVNAAENIGDAAVGMVQNLKEGDLAGAFDEIAVMGENANNIFASTGSMINYANDTTLNVSNNIQDMGLSRDEVAELDLRRAAGEATNSVGALLKGQTLDEDGRAERTYTGEIASNKDKNRDSGQSGFMDVVDEVVSEANTTRNTVVDAANTGADFAGAVQNFSVPNKMTKGRLHGKTPTINDAINKNRNQEGAQP